MFYRYTALHLANSIVICTRAEYKEPYNFICLLKLMKLSYIVLGNYLAVRDDDFFDEEVEAWRYGPVIPSIWHNYKQFFLYNEIRLTEKIFDKVYNNRFEWDKPDNYDNFLWDLVIDVCDKYKNESPNGMVELTHGENTPWFTYKPRLRQGERNIYMDKDKIRKYYQDNKNILLNAARNRQGKKQ